ncbi:MAG: helix-turn-helix domain-containing protein [Gemmatales bacterium]
MMRKKRQTNTHEALLLALACGATVEAAAAKSGVTKRTVYRYLEDESFRRELQAYRAQMVYRATGMLTAAAMEAVKTLLGLMNGNHAAAAKLGAAKAVLDLGLKLRQASELEDRMAKIEDRLEQRSNSYLAGE